MPYYAVVNGRTNGIYDNWPECIEEVRGYSKAVFRKFTTLKEAENYFLKYLDLECNLSDPEFDPKYVIYTDGSTLQNGKKGAASGYGVYFGPDDIRNCSVPLPKVVRGIQSTNQRAELFAVMHAMKQINKAWDLRQTKMRFTIRTDSKYVINCITNWLKKWEINGYKNLKGSPVHNQDLIKDCISLRRHLAMDDKLVRFEHVRAHNGEEGNIEADKLARKAAKSKEAKFCCECCTGECSY